jgi:hypothetical protein
MEGSVEVLLRGSFRLPIDLAARLYELAISECWSRAADFSIFAGTFELYAD